MAHASHAYSISRAEGVLAQVPLFSALRPGRLESLAAEAKLHRAKKGYVLFTQNDMADWLYVIADGWVKLSRETIDGSEVVLDLLTVGDIFGETTYFTDGIYPFSAEMAVDGAFWMLPVRVIEDEIKAHPPFAMTMMRHMAQAKMARDKEIERHNLQSAAQRLGCFLLRLSSKDGGARESSPIHLQLPVDKHLIASYLGIKPETFSRALGKLGDEVGVVVGGVSVTVPRLDDLVRYTCRACSNAFPCDG